MDTALRSIAANMQRLFLTHFGLRDTFPPRAVYRHAQGFLNHFGLRDTLSSSMVAKALCLFLTHFGLRDTCHIEQVDVTLGGVSNPLRLNDSSVCRVLFNVSKPLRFEGYLCHALIFINARLFLIHFGLRDTSNGLWSVGNPPLFLTHFGLRNTASTISRSLNMACF